MAEHRNYPKNGKVDEPSGEHFRLPGHAVSDLFGLAIEHVKSNDPFVLKAREALLIRKFDSYRNGLNKDPGSLKVLPLLESYFLSLFGCHQMSYP